MNERMNGKPGRRELLHRIDMESFAVDEVKLYLDTHPDDAEALAFFQRAQQKPESGDGRVCQKLYSAYHGHGFRFLRRYLEMDSGALALAGRRMLGYVEL